MQIPSPPHQIYTEVHFTCTELLLAIDGSSVFQRTSSLVPALGKRPQWIIFRSLPLCHPLCHPTVHNSMCCNLRIWAILCFDDPELKPSCPVHSILPLQGLPFWEETLQYSSPTLLGEKGYTGTEGPIGASD